MMNSELSSTSSPTDDVTARVDLYNMVLSDLLDVHAPATSRTVKTRAHTPWFTHEIKSEKQERRRLEKKWRFSKLEIDRQLYCKQKQHVHSLLRKSKHAYYQQSISDCGNDSKKMFKFANALLNRKQTSPLPANACSKSLASIFSQFFVSKIDSIRRHLCTDVAPLPPLSCIGLATLADTTSEEIESLIRNNPVKSCELDPIPTKLLKECAAIISPYIADVVNPSLQSGKVPKALKIAHIHPLLKKPSLDPECLQNYRPVSNLPYLSKLLERVAFSRLYDYLQENDLLDNHQSAYRANHSVETLLVNLSNNILTEMDVGRITAIVLLDLSAAFDTVDHRILVNVLSSIGIRDHALEWFMSYLQRCQPSRFYREAPDNSPQLPTLRSPSLSSRFI